MTPAMLRALRDLRAAGDAAFVTSTGSRATAPSSADLRAWLANVAKVYGRRVATRTRQQCKAVGVKAAPVWVGRATFVRLLAAGAIEEVRDVPGAFRLTPAGLAASERGGA